MESLTHALLDIDECALEINNCEQLCVNLNGSYSCECSEGYEVSRSRSYVCKGNSFTIGNQFGFFSCLDLLI